MATLAVIPARLAATRLPRKPLRTLGGEPLIVRVWQRVSAMGIADACVVATDSPIVADIVRQAGAECELTRDDHASGTDRVAEVAHSARYRSFDTIVNVQGDEPFISMQAIEAATALVREQRFPLGTVAVLAPASVLADPNVVKVVCADDGRALYFSRAGIPFVRSGSGAATVRRHLGVYVYTREALTHWVGLPVHPLEAAEQLEQLRPLAAGLAMGVATIAASWEQGVDTEEDLVRANKHWSAMTAERV
jgi:3-deoxy-manno-octulosonate cytidylyltransferase (CMP-KDO synthetase)